MPTISGSIIDQDHFYWLHWMKMHTICWRVTVIAINIIFLETQKWGRNQ